MYKSKRLEYSQSRRGFLKAVSAAPLAAVVTKVPAKIDIPEEVELKISGEIVGDVLMSCAPGYFLDVACSVECITEADWPYTKCYESL